MHECFRLEIAFTGKTMGIVVKSSKTLQDALSAVLQKHHLKPQEALVTMVSVCMNETIICRQCLSPSSSKVKDE